MISKLHLKNFIAFTDLSIDFSPGINIVIGWTVPAIQP